MRKEEFYKLYGHPSAYEDIKDYRETSKIREIVFVDFVYNQMLNANRNLPLDYKIEMSAIWSEATYSQLNTPEEKLIKKALEKSKIANELVKRGEKVSARVHRIARVPNGDIHGWHIYVEFEMNVESLALYWGDRYKRKVLVFLEDGVLEWKHAPYRIKDEVSPVGWIGMTVEEDTVITCY